MDAPAVGHNATHRTTSLSVPFLVLSAILVGIGLFLVMLWFLTASWAYFGLGLAGAVGGGLLLFHRGTGADSA